MVKRTSKPPLTGTNINELLGVQPECHKPVVVVTDYLGRVSSLPHQFTTHTQPVAPS